MRKRFLFLGIIILIAYHNAIFGQFISDDKSLPAVMNHFGDWKYMFIHNMSIISTGLSYFIYRINGWQPFYFHVANIVLHIINVWLVYVLVKELCHCEGAERSKQSAPIAFITAAIFAVHPILTEAVSWVSGQSYLLYTTFILLSLLLFIKKRYWLSLAIFILALLSSVKAVILPLILIVYCWSFARKKLRYVISFAAVVLIPLLIIIVPNIGPRMIQSQAKPDFIMPFVSFATYIRLLFWPDNLTFFHVNPLTTGDYIFSFSAAVLYLLVLLYFWRKDKIAFFWLMFFLIGLLPVITPLPIASFVAERYVYLSSIGMFYVAVRVFIYFSRTLRASRYPKLQKIPVSGLFILIVLFILTVRTIIRNNDWQTNYSFWRATAISTPFSFQAHDSYGMALVDKKLYSDAIAELTKALILKPDYALGHQNLAYAYQLSGRLSEAIDEYNRALYLYQSVATSTDNISKIYQDLGGAYLSLEQYGNALVYAQKALRLEPANADLMTNVGIVYFKLGNKENARKYFTAALKIVPNFSKANYWLQQLK